MGTDFRKLKVPLVWYDLLHVLDVLSRFHWLKDDPRLLDMLELLKSKADDSRAVPARIGLDRLEGLGVRPEERTLPLADPAGVAHPGKAGVGSNYRIARYRCYPGNPRS